MKKFKNTLNERRKFLRIKYRPSERPILRIGKNEYEILDLSEMGLAFGYTGHIKFEKTINGMITFLSGDILGIEGNVAWNRGQKVGIKFTFPLLRETIIREHKLRSEKFLP